MAASAPVKTSKAVSFLNTPQAKDDVFTGTEDVAPGFFTFDVMANDAGGNAKRLHSIGSSEKGTSMRIDDGKVAYELSESAYKGLQSLAEGELFEDTFTYAIQMGNGTLSWATAKIEIKGVNDAPVFTYEPGKEESTVIKVAENFTGSFYTLTTTDPESQIITYGFSDATSGSINDNAFFNIDHVTGALSFKTSPNFESPVGGDNSYTVQVKATDEQGSFTTRDVVVNVTDVQETVPLLVNFNDFNLGSGSYQFFDKYMGFNWSSKMTFTSEGQPIYLYNHPVVAYYNDVNPNIASNHINNNFYTETSIRRQDESVFSLISLKLGDGLFAQANGVDAYWNANEVRFEGWKDGVLSYPAFSVQQVISEDGFIDVLLNFSTINELRIIVVGGADYYGTSFGVWSIDDMLFEVAQPIPIQTAML